jgi:bifunctional non-homologous end joining protein LigD
LTPSHGLTATLVVFDVLACVGEDLRQLPWTERRRRLDQLLAGATGAVRSTPFFDAADPVAHRLLIADGWEGTIAKRTSSRYTTGRRSSAWVKVKSAAARDRDRGRVLASL